MMAVAILTGCSEKDETDVVNYSPVDVSLAFSVPDMYEGPVVQTRMADSVVQMTDGYYRGLKEVHIIPFETTGTITKNDNPFIFDEKGLGESGRVAGKPSKLTPDSAFYFYPGCSFWPGTASLLFYARGANTVQVNGVTIPADNKAYYGSTLMTGADDRTPSRIQFSPEQIWSATTVDDRAQALADYLTAIANTTGWAVTEDPKLKALYYNFLHQDASGNSGIIAGSSACVRAFIEELYREAGDYETNAGKSVAEAVRASIKAGATVDNEGHLTLTSWNGTTLTGYPANIGLPDGAAAIQWNGTAFQPQTKTSVESAITSMDRFVYPAELCYYGNSTIRTSKNEVEKTVYQKETTWNDVLGHYKTGTVVKSNIKSAAMVSSVQYAVARLCVKLGVVDLMTIPLEDANGDMVTFDNTYYPLTAVIVGGQYPVGFDCRPETVQPWPTAEKDQKALTDQMFFVYDTEVKTKKTGDTYDYYYLNSTADMVASTNTLVLQSYEKQNVTIVLEFENRSNMKFMGHDGIVYPGTKFYLVGEVNPAYPTVAATVKTDENKDRVFTQDYITTFNIRIESFKFAYNVMPDLLASKMEIGVKVAQWESIRPTTVELHN